MSGLMDAASAGSGMRSVVMEKTFAYPAEKVWRALTESGLLAEWLLKNNFEPEVGRKFQFQSDPVPQWDGVIECEVKVLEPLKRLEYSWETMGTALWVAFTLTPAEGGTRLRMEQSGFGPGQDFAYKGATYGWQRFLGQLEPVLEGMA